MTTEQIELLYKFAQEASDEDFAQAMDSVTMTEPQRDSLEIVRAHSRNLTFHEWLVSEVERVA